MMKSVTTVHLELLFFFTLPSFPLRFVATSPAPCNSLELNYPSIPRLEQGALWTAPLLLLRFSPRIVPIFVYSLIYLLHSQGASLSGM